jgi:hypothetical protein
MAAAAAVLAFVDSFWLAFAAIPPAFGALLCIAPWSWLSNAKYRRTINVLAYISMVPAAIALSAAVGFVTIAIIALPAAATFVFVMRQSLGTTARDASS